MLKKKYIAFGFFSLALLYIVSPWFFEKKLFFNELLAISGFAVLGYKKFKIPNSGISRYLALLIALASLHAVISIFRADSLYYYLRNMVILYSMFTFFLGYFLFNYAVNFINSFRFLIKNYILVFLFLPVNTFFFDRFGMSSLFPPIIRNNKFRIVLLLLILMNIIYAINYDSLTMLILSLFYLFLYLCPGYRFFQITMILCALAFAALFVFFRHNLTIDAEIYSHFNNNAIYRVINSNPVLAIDPSTTWRLVIWKQIIVDLFPSNLLGIGFGTPALKYFPVEDPSKLATLPYVLGAHNSFIYLFGRLGIAFVFIISFMYSLIFKEYFYYKDYYSMNSRIWVFYSFFAITAIAFFNPVLESPIYASSYWLTLGFLARIIYERKGNYSMQS